MKSNIIKYIFIVIVIGLVIYSAYIIYGNKEEHENKVETVKTEQEPEVITNIRIPVVNFDTINPILSKNQNIQDISRLVYEPLLNIDENYKIQLCLASEWSKTTPTSYVIKLKDNVKWQDGNMLTAKDVQFTIDKLKDANVNSIYAYNVQHVISVEVIDDNTIRINLDKEIPFFEYNLTFPIMSYRYFENEDFINTTRNSTPVGTGRFKVTLENDNIVLKQNQNWWNNQNETTKLTQIYIVKYNNMGEVYNAFKIGNIDLFTTSSLEIENYIGTIGYNTKEYMGRELDFIAFNCNSNVLSNKEVRQAISYAIDKQNIVSAIYSGKYYTCNFPFEYGNYLYGDNKVSYEYNIENARKILQDNGWTYNKKTWQKTKDYKTIRLRLNLVVNSSNEKRVQVAENIKASLENLGITINIIKANDSQYKRYLENKNYDMILTGVYTPYSPDLTTYFGENNLANFNNQEANNIIKEVNNITDEKLLKEKYNQLINIYKEEMPYIFLYNNRKTLVYSLNLMGEITPNNYNIFYNMGSWYRQ